MTKGSSDNIKYAQGFCVNTQADVQTFSCPAQCIMMGRKFACVFTFTLKFCRVCSWVEGQSETFLPPTVPVYGDFSISFIKSTFYCKLTSAIKKFK